MDESSARINDSVAKEEDQIDSGAFFGLTILLRKVDPLFGLQFAIIQLDSSQVELICFAIINYIYPTNSAQSVVSMLLASLGLGYYLWLAYCISVVASDAWERITTDKETSLTKVLQSHKYSVLRVLYEGYRLPDRRLQLFMPLIYIARSIMIAAVVFTLTSHPWRQLILVIAVELLFFLFVAIHRVKSTKAANFVDISNGALNIVFLLLKGFTMMEIQDRTRQIFLGIPMAIVLLIGALLNITFLMISTFVLLKVLIIKLYNLSRHLCRKKKSDSDRGIKKSTSSQQDSQLPNKVFGSKESTHFAESAPYVTKTTKNAINQQSSNLASANGDSMVSVRPSSKPLKSSLRTNKSIFRSNFSKIGQPVPVMKPPPIILKIELPDKKLTSNSSAGHNKKMKSGLLDEFRKRKLQHHHNAIGFLKKETAS